MFYFGLHLQRGAHRMEEYILDQDPGWDDKMDGQRGMSFWQYPVYILGTLLFCTGLLAAGEQTFYHLTFDYPHQVESKNILHISPQKSKTHQLLVLDMAPIKYIVDLLSEKENLVVELHYILRWARMAPGLAVADHKPRIGLASHRLLATLFASGQVQEELLSEKYLAVWVAKRTIDFLWQRRLKNKIDLGRKEPCYIIVKNSKNNMTAYYPAVCKIPFANQIPELLQLKEMMAAGKNNHLDSHCASLPGNLQPRAWRLLGDYYFRNNDFVTASHYYQKAGYTQGLTSIGLTFFRQKKVKEALSYFDIAGSSIWRARSYSFLADRYKEQNKRSLALQFYKKGVAEYEKMANSFGYHFTIQDNRDRRRCIAETIRLAQGLQVFQEKVLLRDLLKGLAAYCAKLDQQYFMFFCHEVIKDYVDFSLEFKHRRPIANTFVYDYQLLKEKNKIKEQRILLEENGEKKHMEDARLFTNFQYENLVMGPQVLFAKNWQNFYDYRLHGQSSTSGAPVYLIEAIPKDLPTSVGLIAKIWVKHEGQEFDILKIQWNGKTIIKNFDELINLEYLYGADLKINFLLEFNLEKLGVRLPSRFFIEVAYQRDTGERFIRSRSEVTFTNHKFFNVDTQVKHQSPEKK